MKHLYLTLVFAVAPLFLHAEPASVLGKIGDIEITTREFQESIAGLEKGRGAALEKDPAALGQYARALLIQRLVLKQALDKKWDQEPAVIAKLVRAREATLAESYLDAASAPEPSHPSEAELQEAYEANKEKLRIPKSYLLAQIYIKDAEAAATAKFDAVVKQLSAKGADFAAIARNSSEESASAANGGEIGWLTDEQIQPEIRGKLPKLTLNAISEPIRLNDGWHILKVLDIREARTPTLDEVRDNLVTNLKAERSRIMRQEFIANLLKQHPLAINEIELMKSRSSAAD